MNNKNYIAFICKSYNKNLRIDFFLYIILKIYSRSLIKKKINNKNIFINGKLIKDPNFKIKGYNHIYILNLKKKNKNLILKKEYIKYTVIYEDNDILIIDKPINIVIHPGIKNNNKTLLNGILYFYKINNTLSRAGIIHRLDKLASGLLIIAKNKKIQSYLINLFKLHKIVREYQILIYGNINKLEGIINFSIGKNYKYPIRKIIQLDNKGKSAITKYLVIENFLKYSKLLIKLYTGRTHQIRLHMSYLQHPIIGDYIYGNYINKIYFKSKFKKYSFLRLALQSTKLGIYHITYNQYMEWQLNLSTDISDFIEYIKKYT